MTVVDKAGSINELSSIDTPNIYTASNATNGGKLGFIRDTFEIEASNSAGSKYRIARVPSNAVIDSITIACDAIAGATDNDVGFYNVPEDSDGVVIDKDALADGQTFATASRSLDGLSQPAIENLPKQVWQLAGFATNPGKLVDIVITANALGSAGGTVTATTKFSLI